MGRRTAEVVHVGVASRDITADDPRGWRMGGGVTYGALTTARLGLVTGAIVGVDATTATAPELDLLRAAGVELVLVPIAAGPVFENRDTRAGRRQIAVAAGRVLHPTRMPAGWAGARGWAFAPVAAELEDAWADLAAPHAVVAVAWQGLLRRLVDGRPVARIPPVDRPLLRRADLVGVSVDDLVPPVRPSDLPRFLRDGARLAVTRGADGGSIATVSAGHRVRWQRYRSPGPDRVVDPVGAGDVFLAALLAATVDPAGTIDGSAEGAADVRFAAAAGSLVVEGPGIEGVPDLAQVHARLARDAASH